MHIIIVIFIYFRIKLEGTVSPNPLLVHLYG